MGIPGVNKTAFAQPPVPDQPFIRYLPLIICNVELEGNQSICFVPPTATPLSTTTPGTIPPLPTNTPTVTATNTATPIDTATATATNTPVPPTATNTVTNTPVPPTATVTNTPTRTPTPTNTPTPSVTANISCVPDSDSYVIRISYQTQGFNGVDILLKLNYAGTSSSTTHYDQADSDTIDFGYYRISIAYEFRFENDGQLVRTFTGQCDY